jgi:hypothetical protein
VNSVLNFRDKLRGIAGHIHLNKFSINRFSLEQWMGVKVHSCLMVIVCTSKFISQVNFIKVFWGCSGMVSQVSSLEFKLHMETSLFSLYLIYVKLVDLEKLILAKTYTQTGHKFSPACTHQQDIYF